MFDIYQWKVLEDGTPSAHKYPGKQHFRGFIVDDSQSKMFINNMKEFLSLCKTELGLEKLPKIEWIIGKHGVNGQTFGEFGNKDQTIKISIRGRHPLDIMRTLAHELVHYLQWTEGRLKPDSGKTGSAEENEAHAKAGIIMRHFDRAFPDAFSLLPLTEDNRRVRAIEPKTLDTIYNIQNYGRQSKALQKATNDAERRKKEAQKKVDDEKRRETDPEFNTFIRVYSLAIPVKAIRYWRKSKDVEWILKLARSWRRFASKSWPKEVVDDIHNDPEWRENVIRIFELADSLLKLKEMPASNRSYSTGSPALDRLGIDPQEPIAVYRNLGDITNRALAKHNIDKTGRRLPSRR